MIPLSVPNLSGNEWKYVKECIDTGWVSGASRTVERFQDYICKYTKAKYAVACVNATCGLHIALRLVGVKSEDEVIVPALSFIAPVNVVRYLNAEPVFMDCDDYMNIDADKLNDFCKKHCQKTKSGLKNKKTKRIIKAVLPVHIFGNPCNLSAIMKTAKKYELKVIEDAAESIGSYYTQGLYKNRFTGTIGDFGVYSFNGNKIITSGGGGMIVTNNKDLAKKAEYLVNQAKDDPERYVHKEVGYNFRMTGLEAALGIAQLEQLEKFIKIKRTNYELYKRELENIRGLKLLEPPLGTRPNWWFYCLLVDKKDYGIDREELMQKLKQEGIQTRSIWYLNHLQKPYRKNEAYRIEKAIWFWKGVLNIPCSTNLKVDEIKKVSHTIRRIPIN